MADFQPEKITKKHILDALDKAKKNKTPLIPSTKFDVIIDGVPYPPKAIMRLAHKEANGSEIWEKVGGKPTNKFLEKFGFEITTKDQNKLQSKSQLEELVESYQEALKNTNWLKDEAYKFRFNKWVYENIDFKKDSNGEIKRKIDESQEKTYDEDGTKGVNFIMSIKRFTSDFVTKEDIIKLKLLANKEIELNAKNLKFSFGSTFKASIFLSFFDPYEFTVIDQESIPAFKYLTRENDLPKKGIKAFHYYQGKYQEIKKQLKESKLELKPFQDLLGKSNLNEQDWNYITQDFLLFITRNIIPKQSKIELIGQLAKQKLSSSKHFHPISNHFWGQNSGELFYWISAFPSDSDIPSIQLHYEIYGHNESITIELHAEGTIESRENFSRLIQTFESNKDYRLEDWNHGLRKKEYKGRNFKKLVLNKEIGLETNQKEPTDEHVDFVVTSLKRIYNDVNPLLKQFYHSKIEDKMKIKNPLNQILYGPPGTGKTYKTIDLAVKIASEEEYMKNNHDHNKEIYDKLIKSEQIVFTTFHQSMSYEDFVEGIKPVKPKDNDEYLKYDIEDGIFKQIVEKSIGESKISDASGNVQIDEKYFNSPINKVSLGNSNVQEDDAIYDYCIKNNCIAIGFGEDINFEGVSTKAEIRKKFKENGIEITSTSDFNVSAIERFVLWMKKGQLVFVSNGNRKLRSIGVVEGDYYYEEESPIPYKQFRKVKWLHKEVNLPIREIYGKTFSQQTIYQIGANETMIRFFSQKKSIKKNENYVLIIDEINRGNIASIFGELITLIEEDKRAGNTEALEITLPYSKQKFSVPNNLYIIGTMNTADRSVEALDSALRRRFSFEEMMPKPELLADISWNDISMAGVLETINKRIELLIDRDHTIGHSYFLGLKNKSNNEFDVELLSIFKDKVIPLLQEYFFNDYGKMQMVLGDGFVNCESAKAKIKFAYSNNKELPINDYEDKLIYKLVKIDENFNLIEALSSLLGNQPKKAEETNDSPNEGE